MHFTLKRWEKKWSLKELLENAKSMEISDIQVSQMEKGIHRTDTVNKVQQNKKKLPPGDVEKKFSDNSKKKCFRCDNTHIKMDVPHKVNAAIYCNGSGHF